MAHRFCLLEKYFSIHSLNFKLYYYNAQNIHYLPIDIAFQLLKFMCTIMPRRRHFGTNKF